MEQNKMNLPIDSHMSPRTPMPVSQQQMIHEFQRKRQEEIEAIHLLHTYREDRHSTPCPKPCLNYDHILANHEGTSHHFLSNNQNQMPQLNPQFTRYSPYVRIPPPMPPIYVHSLPSSMSFIPQEFHPLMATTVTTLPLLSENVPSINYMAGRFWFSGNNTSIHSNISTSSIITSLQVPPGAQHNTYNTYSHMNMIASTSTFGVGGASTSHVAAQSGVSLHCPYTNPLDALQLSSMPSVVNSSSPCATIILPDYVLPEVEETIRITQASGATNGNGQQQHQEDSYNMGNGLDVVHGNFYAEVTAATSIVEDSYDMGWDEFEITAFFDEDIINGDDQVPLTNTTSTGDLPHASDMIDPKGLIR